MKITEIELSKIKPDPNQPRKEFGNLSKLSASIMKHGLIQPIEVLKINDEEFQIVDGERRFRACKLIPKKDKIKCIVVEEQEIKDKFLRQLVTDFHKKHINPIEQLNAIKKLEEQGYRPNSIKKFLDISNTKYYKIKRLDIYNKNTKEKIKSGELPLKIVNNLSNIKINPKKEDEIINELIKKNSEDINKIDKIVKKKQDYIHNLNSFQNHTIIYLERIKNFIEFHEKNKDLIDWKIKNQVDDILSSELFSDVKRMKFAFKAIEDKLYKLKEKLK